MSGPAPFTGLSHVQLLVTALNTSAAWYRRALGLEGAVRLRLRGEAPFVTDGGHYILDCAFGAIPDAPRLAARLATVPGVVDHGLFIGLASLAIVAGPEGVETLRAVFSH